MLSIIPKNEQKLLLTVPKKMIWLDYLQPKITAIQEIERVAQIPFFRNKNTTMKPRSLDYMFDLVIAFKLAKVPVTFEGIAIHCTNGIQNIANELKRQGFEVIANRPGIYAILIRNGVRIKLLSPNIPECECWSVKYLNDLETISNIFEILLNDTFVPLPEHNIDDGDYKSKFFKHKKTGQITEIYCRQR